MKYSEAFKAKMVQKMTLPGGPSATALARQIGISQSTLSRWCRRAATVGTMNKPSSQPSRRPQDWSAAEKQEAVLEAAALSEPELGLFLRRKGLHQAHLDQWREQMLHGLEQPAAKRQSRHSAERRRIRELEKELRRKEAALAETAALLVLKKKAQAIWGDGDDGTPSSNGK